MAGMTRMTDTRALGTRPLTYTPAGATAVADDVWGPTPAEFRRYERTVDVNASWDNARLLLLRWGVKTRSGFKVDADSIDHGTIHEGANMWLRLPFGPIAVTEPIRVVAVVDDPLRCGFSYGTLEGHPVSGEEAFVIRRATKHDPVELTIRSLTRPAPTGVWRYLFPLLLVAQRWFRKRYLRSLNL